MFTVSRSIEIQRAPGEVFAFAGDYANDPLWRAGVLTLTYETNGPPAVGHRTRETLRSMGRTAVTVGEVTEYSPARTAFRSVHGPICCDGWREFVAVGGGTRFTYSLTLRPRGTLRLVEPVLRLAFARQVAGDVRRLKRRLESAA